MPKEKLMRCIILFEINFLARYSPVANTIKYDPSPEPPKQRNERETVGVNTFTRPKSFTIVAPISHQKIIMGLVTAQAKPVMNDK